MHSSLLSAVLDHLRWVSALMVLAGHARELLFVPHFPAAALPWWAKGVYLATNFQKEAVIVFFVLSGLLVGAKLLDYAQAPVFPLGRYAVERLSRLYVVLLPALALSGVVALAGGCGGDRLRAWAAPLVFLQDVVVPAPSCNEPLWSLANEAWYYVLGALLVVGMRRKVAWLVALVVVAFLLAADNALDGRNVVLYAPIWAMGMLALSPGIPRLRLASAVALLVAALVVSRLHVLDPLYWLRDALTAAALVLVLNAVARRGAVSSPRSSRWGRRLAGFSYSLYLTHWPVLLLIRHALMDGPLDPTRGTSYAIAAMAGVGAFAFAFVFAWFTERHTGRVRRWLLRLGAPPILNASNPIDRS